MGQSIQSGNTAITGAVSVISTTPASSSQYIHFKISPGTSPIIGTANASNWALVPTSIGLTTPSFNIKNVEQKGRIVFGQAITVPIGGLYSVIVDVYGAGGLNWTVQFYHVATDGTLTQIGGDIVTGVLGTNVTKIQPSTHAADITFAAGEGLQMEVINTYTSTAVSAGDGIGFLVVVK